MPDLGLADYSATVLVFLTACGLVAGVVRGFSGFGSAFIFMPLASAVVGPKIAAAVILLIDLVAAAPMIPEGWRLGDKRDVGTMALGLPLGIPIGAWALTHSDPLLVRWLLVALIIPMLALLMSGWRYGGRPIPILTVAVGAMSGLLSGVAQMGGPPIILYWLGSASKAGVVRANVVLFFAVSTAMTTGIYAASGLLPFALVGLVALTGPAYGMGIWIGSRMFRLANERTFRRLCYALIALAALIGMPLFDGILR
jgi:uncharacterized membrane protein YfcA